MPKKSYLSQSSQLTLSGLESVIMSTRTNVMKLSIGGKLTLNQMEISKTLPQQFFSLLDHHGFQCLPYCHKCHHRISFLKWGWRCRNTHRQHHLKHHHLEAGSVLSSASEKIQVLSHTCDLEFSGCRAQKSFIFNGTSVQHLESSGMKRLC